MNPRKQAQGRDGIPKSTSRRRRRATPRKRCATPMRPEGPNWFRERFTPLQKAMDVIQEYRPGMKGVSSRPHPHLERHSPLLISDLDLDEGNAQGPNATKDWPTGVKRIAMIHSKRTAPPQAHQGMKGRTPSHHRHGDPVKGVPQDEWAQGHTGMSTAVPTPE